MDGGDSSMGYQRLTCEIANPHHRGDTMRSHRRNVGIIAFATLAMCVVALASSWYVPDISPERIEKISTGMSLQQLCQVFGTSPTRTSRPRPDAIDNYCVWIGWQYTAFVIVSDEEGAWGIKLVKQSLLVTWYRRVRHGVQF